MKGVLADADDRAAVEDDGAGQRQQWCTRLSRIVGEDLTPEFQFLLK